MRRIFVIASLVLASFPFFCGISAAQAPLEESCTGSHCTEAELNAPLGPDEVVSLSHYDDDPSNPPRESLKFPAFDANWGLKQAIFDKAAAFYEQNKEAIPNPRYVTIIDFNKNSSQKRFFLFDLSNGALEMHNVAHGKNSDPNNDGFATNFSNAEGSLMSSLGFYFTLTTYAGNHGYSLRLQGLESTNNNAESRAIVMHPAEYVSDSSGHAGRSWGCPAIDPTYSKEIIDKVRNGSLLLIDK